MGSDSAVRPFLEALSSRLAFIDGSLEGFLGGKVSLGGKIVHVAEVGAGGKVCPQSIK